MVHLVVFPANKGGVLLTLPALALLARLSTVCARTWPAA